MAIERTAQCHCGALRVIASGDPGFVNLCHCQACQRRTGAVVHSGAYYPKAQVRIEGASKVYVRTAAEGRKLRFHFCPECGSNVYWDADLRPDFWGIAVGAFADPNFPAPTASVWEESKHGWVAVPPGVQHFPRGRQ
ncbi:MAG TPA: GFA family protein [Stellaceae bacterium]|nr:GFA family protein [Stellaceae bacterium]